MFLKVCNENDLEIVVVADTLDYKGADLDWLDRRIDRPDKHYVKQMIEALQSSYQNVTLYTNPIDFQANIEKHYQSLVLPYWFGENSRNRHALVPAICETNNIRYMGGDIYTKTVCNDKALSKILCKKAGLRVADDVTIYDLNDIKKLSLLNYPCVVKPFFEGTSLGITQKNLVEDVDSATNLSLKLLEEFSQPILVEEFVAGKEVSICLLGWKEHISHWHAAERYRKDDENYFYSHLYGYHEKKSKEYNLALRSVKKDIDAPLLQSCQRIFSWLDKVEYIRIDGKLHNNVFTVLELTPETHLGANAEFCGTLAFEELTYKEILSLMVNNSLMRYQNLNSNLK
ncbi:hypothetical protein [Thalassomonas sp. RHCl1]|uniref:hypothetical protein n=1 Tax=Thalassomonas sp. RHCl1 TaxID=2995320 RepID=UPI00248AF113|nr:hypothetical protein [Thalassomonas sp. RHCl1]